MSNVPVRFRQRLARHGWLVAIAAAYLYVFPYFPRLHSANELPRVYLAQAIVEDHAFAIDRGVARYGATADVSPSAGHFYSNKAPGSSLLAAPAYAVAHAIDDPGLGVTMWLCRVFAGIVPALAFLYLLDGFLARFAPDPAVRKLVVIAYALGSMAMTYAMLFYSHQLAAACIGSAWILAIDVVERRRGLVAMGVAGLLAGATPLVDYQAVFAGLPVAAYVLARLWRWPRRELVRALAVAIGAAALPVAVLLAYHAACFGSPWRTGYDASETFAQFHRHGFLGLTGPRWSAFVGSLFAPDNGLFVLAPWLVLAIPGTLALWRRGERGIAVTCAAVALIFIAFVSSISFWRGGWGVGPRYITALLPFLLPPIAAALTAIRARPLVLASALALIVVGVVVYALAAATFPYWPGESDHTGDPFRNPLYEVAFRLFGDGVVAPNLLSALGVAGAVGLVPYLALVAGLVGATIVAVARWRGLALAVGLAAWLIAALSLVPHGDATAELKYHRVVELIRR